LIFAHTILDLCSFKYKNTFHTALEWIKQNNFYLQEAEELGHRKVGGISKLDILSKLEPGDTRNQAGHRHHHHHIHGGAHHTKVNQTKMKLNIF
jgi:hypothetical protein